MLSMILKMSAISALYIVLTVFLWKYLRNKKISFTGKILIGLIYGMCSVLSTHFGVDFGDMLLNLRDVAPLAAGLFFHPLSGVIAGLIGGIERYIVGTYFGIGSYTRIACSVSTCLAGFVALLMNLKVFRGKKPSPMYAFFMGAVMEVFHMYAVFISHRADMRMAFVVVRACSIPMIIFSGIALAVMSIILEVIAGEWKNPFKRAKGEDISVSQTFQRWLFVVTVSVIFINFIFSFILQTQSAYQNGYSSIIQTSSDIKNRFKAGLKYCVPGASEYFEIIKSDGTIIAGKNIGSELSETVMDDITGSIDKPIFKADYMGEDALNKVDMLSSELILLTYMPHDELFWNRNAQAYETAFADILLFTVIYVLIAFLVRQIVVKNIDLINESLDKITNGNLNEIVTVRNSSEFASLSDDINQTVDTLKGYIEAAENRIEQELVFARTIQESSLPRNFEFPGRNDEFEIYASMKAAKEVGGDFYDFFFVDRNKIALVIADVSGKGIPAALFMMRSKTAIRSFAETGGSPSEILERANNTLCEGNDAEMFVTAWIGIVDLETGLMKCANAGHEYPLIKRVNGEFEIIKDKHSLALAAVEGIKPKEYDIELHPGDKVFVYTDGIPEAINEEVIQYGSKRLVDVINKVKDKSFTEILPFMSDSVAAFRGSADQFDDITMLGFELKKLVR
ncbi:HAMP/SpoIIE domain-containing protein [Butyrivibrio proteoclasticus B316]|uniref:HAMP/SpoIIE domain-containing protein n=2 Tax=Butyrivibrio proteoclasticus TaxID=43305 RepID=E0S1Z2_BUTPB|nr:HAMP/SpoIIE domain-containing protein [Butyrivibrio proteoclasticus B316]